MTQSVHPSRFVRTARQSGLVTGEQLDRVLAERRGGDDDSDQLLADLLVTRGELTSYQAEQILQGRTKFSLGPYLITDWLGQGGMGQVFKARHDLMGREVAIKVLPHEKSSPEAIQSFTREIRTQAQLDHSQLVRAFDAGHEGNVYFLVTEYVPGTDLRRLVRMSGRLNLVQAASIIRQVALGLAHAHERGLIHRDIKPGNILVTPRGEAKLSDLGLAGFLHHAEDDPRAGKIVGTADYLAPEQIRNPQRSMPVSDIYALGCTLYYAVTAKVPFPGGTTRDKVRRHLEEMPWHPRRINPDLSEELVDIIADMMEKDYSRRIPTAMDVAQRLEPWARDRCNLPSDDLSRSPWKAAPVPNGMHDTADDEEIDLSGLQDSQYSSAQISDHTQPLSSSAEETRVDVPAPKIREPKPVTAAATSTSAIGLIIAAVVPLSIILGVMLTLLFQAILRT